MGQMARCVRQAPLGALAVVFAFAADPCHAGKGKPLRKGVDKVEFLSSADSTMQPALFHNPETDNPAPLLVGLHTWSGNYMQSNGEPYAGWCVRKKWAFIYPNFRGPNRRPEATGSELVVKDILSAVEYAKQNAKVDEKRIYLVGASGGGYTSLLMAGRAPEVWAGVSAWVPISDLKAWYLECKKAGRGYGRQVAASCGGPPGASPEVDAQYKKRSPLTHLKNAANVALDINAGIHDGHKGSVPISHTLRAFNEVAAAEHRLTEEEITHFVDKESVPPHLVKPLKDRSYGTRTPLFRRSSGKARVTIFEGGHQIIASAALMWLSEQKKP